MSSKSLWLTRKAYPDMPYMALCLSKEEYQKATERMKIRTSDPWLPDRCDGAVHTFQSKSDVTCVICIDDSECKTLAEVIGLIAHEVVHVWQQHKEQIRELAPGIEQEAYVIGNLTQIVVASYLTRRKDKQWPDEEKRNPKA